MLRSPRLPFLLGALFAASGCSALIYEIVWLQLLELVIGSTAVSMAVLLGTYMGGMCVGSLALARLVSPQRHPLRVYAAIEGGIAVSGMAVLAGMPYVDRLYVAAVGHGYPGILLRGAVCAICLLAPTLLMGASLPAIARWFQAEEGLTAQGVSWLGLLYAANIAGAVLGCLLAGFYLLRVHDVTAATLAAAAMNGAVAVLALAMAARAPHESIETPASIHPQPAAGAGAIYLAIALSGLSALGAEVVWTRLLSLMLGATVYTFSIILAVFLVGLGIGSGAGSLAARRSARPRQALAWCQLLLAAAIAWTAWALARLLPYWKMPAAAVTHPWLRFELDCARTLLALLPATILWGASFPLALAAAASRARDAGRLVGRIYAANTAGAILGATGFSLLVIPRGGTLNAERLLIGLALAAAGCAASRPWRAGLLAPAAIALALAFTMPAVPWGAVAYGRQLPVKQLPGKLLYLGEGMNSSIAITDLNGTRMFHVAGKVEASNEQQDMRVERMLGHMPALLHPAARSALVVGCGAGVTAGSLVVHPEMERVVICEIEPLIPRAVARYFARENHDVLRNPRTHLVYDDARHYILTTRDTFDIITSDPIHPWVKGSATLYTQEYFELCKRHLNPGGVIAQWVPLYESDTETVKSEIATFFEVFPDGVIWSNDTVFEEGYDVVLFARMGPVRIDVRAFQQRLQRPDHAAVAESLREIGFPSALSLLATYAGRGRDFTSWLVGAQINRDRNLRLQFLAGMQPDLQGGFFIYDEMLRYRQFPQEVFITPEENRPALKRALGMGE